MAREVIQKWTFGKPSLTSANNGKVRWTKGSTSPLDQKGSSGWVAELYGGVQTGDDWARLNTPVNELSLPLFLTAQWSYYQTNAEVYGVNMVIWAHDPTDFDKRIEITQAPSHAGLEKGAGWNAHELDVTVTQFFYFGENVSGSGLTAGTQYTWAQFQTDALFRHWNIYRITHEWGWYSTGTFESAYVAEVKFNNEQIPLQPTTTIHRKTVQTSKTMLATAKTTDEVISEATSSATDWDFDFGGTGYITKAWLANSADITPRLRLYLFTRPPTGELDDEDANTNPVTADLPFFVGTIDFPAMSQQGTGDAFALATPSTTGNLPLEFDSPIIYGVLVQRDATTTFTATALTIVLTADMEDN